MRLLLLLLASDPEALLQSSYRDDLEAVDRLIRSGADVNAANDLGATPLWAAAQNGSAAMVRRLLDAGANPNLALLKGETPLMMAARAGKVDVVRQLLAKGAKPDARAARGQTALMWAVAQKHPEVVKALLAGGADLTLRTETWSEVMAVPPHGDPQYNKAIPHGNDTALLFAGRVGDLDSAKLLVAAGANVNDADAWGVTALILATHSDYRELAEFLLSKDADPNLATAGFTALHNAIMHRDEKLVAALLAHGANPNTPLRTWTPTRRSSKDFHYPPSLIGATPFWLAARTHQPGVMRLLVKHGADPLFVHRVSYMHDYNEPRNEETTALDAAMGKGSGSAWAQPHEDLRAETIKLAEELGIRKGAK